MYDILHPLFVTYNVFTKFPIVLEIPFKIPRSHKSHKRGYGDTFSKLKHSSQFLMYKPMLFEKYVPPSNTLFLSSKLDKIVVKKPFKTQFQVNLPFEFICHFCCIHFSIPFSLSRPLINLHINAWTFICW